MLGQRRLRILAVGSFAGAWIAACDAIPTQIEQQIEVPEGIAADYICEEPVPDPGDPPVYADCYPTGSPPPPYVPPPPVDDPPEGGGGEPPPGDDDPCETGDATIDAMGRESILHSIWWASLPNEPMLDRRERGGWIVKSADGSLFLDVWPFPGTVCSIKNNDQFPPLPASGQIVGYIHSHPYNYGDVIPICDDAGNVTSERQMYKGIPSTEDFDTSLYFGNELGLPGGLQGYIVDGDRVSSYIKNTPDGGMSNSKPRCGY